MKYMKFLFLILIASLIFLACDDKKPFNQIDTVFVSGAVLADYHFQDHNPPLNSIYYSQQTGRKAYVAFTDSLDVEYGLLTNSQSQYNLNLRPGVYNIKVETDHSYPRYFEDVSITGDTTIKLETKYDFYIIDSVIIDFYYGNDLTSIGPIFTEDAEIEYLEELNELVGNRLQLNDYLRVDSDTMITMNGAVYHQYRIPLVEGVRTYDAYSRVQMVIRSGLHEFPSQMKLSYQTYLITIYVDFFNGGIDIIFDPETYQPYDGFYTPPESTYHYYDTIWRP